MLEAQEGFNNLSPELRKEIESRISSFGNTVRYKFNLERKNPDPQKYNGEIIYPSMYNLDPVTFNITDKYEKNGSKLKKIGIIERVTKNGLNTEISFIRVRVKAVQKGLVQLDATNEDDLNMIAYIELHPKLEGGLFQNTTLRPMIKRIDEFKTAEENRKVRSERKKALDAAEQMSDKEVIEFVDAMSGEDSDKWDSTRDMGLLRDLIEELAEGSPSLFNDKINSEKTKVQAVIKKGIDMGVLGHNPATGTLSYKSTGQSIISLGLNSTDKSDLERFATWFMEGGKKADEAYKKIKSLSTEKVNV